MGKSLSDQVLNHQKKAIEGLGIEKENPRIATIPRNSKAIGMGSQKYRQVGEQKCVTSSVGCRQL